ncbi:MAG: ribonuclease Z [Bacteroidales bacterium]|nr:ribonuclease Z [Bacteroidales bacterium]
MNFYTTVLGSGAALPTVARHCSGQVVNLNGHRILLDCGENTQTQIRVYHQKMQGLSTICITHLHGDHFFGLPGLISSMHLCGRTEPVDIIAPEGISQVLSTILTASGSHLEFEIRYHELSHTEGMQLILENLRCRIYAFPLMHSVPTYGYLIEEKPRGKNPSRKYAYCTDTGYTESFLPFVQGANLLCLESTFNTAFASVAAEKQHLTAAQAATLAHKANVQHLLLTHISARYKEPETLLSEAQAIFPSTTIAADGDRIEVHYNKPAEQPPIS